MNGKHIAALLLAPLAVAAVAFTVGRATAPAPPPAVPSNEQLTVAAGTLVHGLEVQNDYALSTAPDFVGCHKVKAGLACDFGVSYIDESSAVWELVLNRRNQATVIRRLKQARAPAA